jgi:hypothetical protein
MGTSYSILPLMHDRFPIVRLAKLLSFFHVNYHYSDDAFGRDCSSNVKWSITFVCYERKARALHQTVLGNLFFNLSRLPCCFLWYFMLSALTVALRFPSIFVVSPSILGSHNATHALAWQQIPEVSATSWEVLKSVYPRFDSRRCQIIWVAVCLERRPLSPSEDKWGATWKKSSGSGLENWH